MAMQLSKSDYMMYLKHPAWLWLKKHDKAKLPEIDENLHAIFDTGHAFEPYAESRFPGGVQLGFADFSEYKTLPARTHEELAKGTKTLFQGRLEFEELTCIFDILDRVETNLFDLYEIKSSTKEKTEHIEDLAFQKHVLEKSGIPIRNLFVIVANTNYVRQGEIDANELTQVIDVTARVNELAEQTLANIDKALAVMHSKERPDISPRHVQQHYLKEWLEIFLSLHANTDPYSIYRLSSLRGDLIGELEDQGIELIQQIPDEYGFENAKHKRVVALAKQGSPVIQGEAVSSFLRTLQFPLYFFDYETMSSVIPLFDGTRPYQQVPMQYSLHILREPGDQLEHKEFLHQSDSNPGLPLLTQLKQDIGETGSVLVWYEAFEKGRNQELGQMFPEYLTFVEQLNMRVVDLMKPFSEGWYEDYRFLGSASIKKVLPVLAPDLSYKEMEIGDGQTAQRIWMETILEKKHLLKQEQIMRNLLAYCKLDTLAMVRIYKFLIACSGL